MAFKNVFVSKAMDLSRILLFVRRQTIRLVCAGDVGVGNRVRRAGIQGCN